MRSIRIRTRSGFTLVELTAVMAIGALLLLLAYAPYGYYGDKAKVRLSGERIKQSMGEAKLLASGGYTRSDGKNGDIVLVFQSLSGSVFFWSVPHGSGAYDAQEVIRPIPLEDGITVSPFPASSSVALLYRAPNASGSIVDEDGPSSLTGVTIGKKGAQAGTLSTFVPFK